MSAFPGFLQNTIGQIQGEQWSPVAGPKTDNPLVRFYIDAMNRANEANLMRYKQAAGVLEGQGTATKTDISRATESGFAQDTQSLIDRGLYNTSTLDASRRRRDEMKMRENQRVDESVAGRMGDLIASRTDQGPDLNALTQLLLGLGQGQGLQQSQGRAYSRTTSPSLPNMAVGGNMGGAAAGGGGGGGSGGNSIGGGGGAAQGVQTYTNPTGRDIVGYRKDYFGKRRPIYGKPKP